MKHWQHAINSMTEEEIKNPEIIEKQTTRLGRIAKGSGTTIVDVNRLLKQFEQTSKMMKMMSGGKGKNMMRAMQNMKGAANR